MIIVSNEKCKGCSLCVKNCPISAIVLVDKKAVVQEICVQCGICTRVCPFGALSKTEAKTDSAVICSNCPIQCRVPLGSTGACKRYTNMEGKLIRNRKLETEPKASPFPDPRITRPIITAVGGGSAEITVKTEDGGCGYGSHRSSFKLFRRYRKTGHQYLHR